jgi:3-oxoacyl-[acyl-carrier-protein] synthase-3
MTQQVLVVHKPEKHVTHMQTPIAVIASIASYLPEKVLTNDDLAAIVDTSDEWITSRTGIRERRIAAADEYTSTLGAKAAQKLLEHYHCDPATIELIIVSTMTPDYLCPSTAALIQQQIRATHAAAIDINAACSGFVYGLTMAKACIESGMYRTILLIAAEKNSAFIDFTDRNTCVLFGDGASACLIRNGGEGLRVRTACLGASGEERDLITINAGGSRLPASPTSYQEKQHVLRMNGKELFKHAVRRMEESINECLQRADVRIQDLRWLVPHQANVRIIDAVAKRFDIAKDHVAITLGTVANTSSSSIPIALDILRTSDQIHHKDLLLLTAVGGGLTWGSVLLEDQ